MLRKTEPNRVCIYEYYAKRLERAIITTIKSRLKDGDYATEEREEFLHYCSH